MGENLQTLLDAFEPVSLSALDERAALMRRVNNKYAAPWEAFVALAERLADDHQVRKPGPAGGTARLNVTGWGRRRLNGLEDELGRGVRLGNERNVRGGHLDDRGWRDCHVFGAEQVPARQRLPRRRP